MVNSLGMMGAMGSMGMTGMSSTSSSGNAHQQLKEKYGVGYEDFGSAPYLRPYPFSASPMPYGSPVKRLSFFEKLAILFHS